ncbi:MAG: PIN domain-containing protein [Burkholderiales bacterium]|nr:PIN domain-containing protein [Burkholderiales bacterium]
MLVDTTVWIDLLRGRTTPAVARLKSLLARGEAQIAPVIVQELLQGATDARSLDTLSQRFTALPMLEPRAGGMTHADAGRLYARCRWAGITIRSPHDCLIAQTAIERGVGLLHDDRDFEFISGVEPLFVQSRR